MNDGIIIINKPHGPTSADCLNRIKRKFRIRKIGHAGTLDPMATGVLVVLLGQATKLADYIMEGQKTYKGTLRLGLETDTYDIQGQVIQEFDLSGITRTDIAREIAQWENQTSQEVPPVSAAKHKGRPLYALQRAGQTVPVKIKKIRVFRAEAIEVDIPLTSFRITCSAGTYVRSLAHSLGRRLGCGAVLTELIREQSHPFDLDKAVELDLLLKSDSWQKFSLPISRALAHWPRLVLDQELQEYVRNGRPLDPDLFPGVQPDKNGMALMTSKDGTPEALARLEPGKGDKHVWTVKRGLWTN
ncbi:tRNA pseudouridine(55) synthase TruB [Desulfonatronovibrio hydrogenovorans]|uniref:tRNA pseudouridine(55) synthase TruB n=1 Tax=Desulfonatronovibrio hydrogenovorans TaxID=53245 RepID=UPI00054CFFF3|nr:tRNA pseudouridine(55) synthase TruB [Desulfonatronovibrio hydrogenovorans]